MQGLPVCEGGDELEEIEERDVSEEEEEECDDVTAAETSTRASFRGLLMTTAGPVASFSAPSSKTQTICIGCHREKGKDIACMKARRTGSESRAKT